MNLVQFGLAWFCSTFIYLLPLFTLSFPLGYCEAIGEEEGKVGLKWTSTGLVRGYVGCRHRIIPKIIGMLLYHGSLPQR